MPAWYTTLQQLVSSSRPSRLSDADIVEVLRSIIIAKSKGEEVDNGWEYCVLSPLEARRKRLL